MSNFNQTYSQQQLNDGLCSIEMLKSLVDNPIQVAPTMFQFANYHTRALADYRFMVKYLQEVYNPPDNNLQLSKQRQQDLHLMRPSDSSQAKKVPTESKTAKPMMDAKKQPEKIFQPLVFPKAYGFPPALFPPVFQNPKAMFPAPVVNPFEPAPLPTKTQVEVNKGINAKRKPQNPTAAPLYEYPQKKLKGTGQGKSPVPKSAKIIELDDDDDEAEIIPKETIQNRIKKANNIKPAIRPLFPTGDKKNHQPYKTPIEIIDSPELISKEQFIIEEEKDGATTNATNFDDFNENTKDGESKDEGGVLDIFDLNIDDLGIKILGEVFLCDKCQKEIPQKDVDKGFKETCASCSKKLKTNNKSVAGNKKNKGNNAAAYKEEPLKYEQENSTEDNKSSSKDDETVSKYDILAPVYQTRRFYEETTNLNIMNSNKNLRPTPLGKMHQTAIIPLNIYGKVKNKKMKKLWNPEKLEHSAYEKFRNDVNGKNSVYLLDEEITEILVRFKYNIEQALTWSMKSNPEFQYYVKKSANRRRIMTRGTGRGYSNIYE